MVEADLGEVDHVLVVDFGVVAIVVKSVDESVEVVKSVGVVKLVETVGVVVMVGIGLREVVVTVGKPVLVGRVRPVLRGRTVLDVKGAVTEDSATVVDDTTTYPCSCFGIS